MNRRNEHAAGAGGVSRRQLVTLAGGAALTWPLKARAQPATMPVIAFLGGASAQSYAGLLAAFQRGLGEGGYVDGRNVTIDYRWADNRQDRLPVLAAELARRQPAVIVACDNAPASAARMAAPKIPIVFTTNGDPLNVELVTTFSRRDGNLTGVGLASGNLAAKRLGLLRELLPQLQVVGQLVDPGVQSYASQRRDAQQAARALGLKLSVLAAASEREIDAAFAALAQQRPRALLVGASPYFAWSRREQIIAAAARHAIPAIYPLREQVVAGGLMSFGPELSDTYRRIGVYAGKILKGATAADLPAEQSSRFELVLNRTTVGALGLEVPARLHALADQFVE
jgi:putative ABC transport system substrate-binding protein